MSLRYRLGEVTLFTIPFKAMTLDRHFSEMDEDRHPRLPPPDEAARTARLYVVRSQPVSQALPRISLADGWLRYVPHQYKRYYVDLQGCFDDYLRRFSPKTRSTLTRKVRKYAEASGGTIDWREYRSPDELETFYAVARDVSAKTYQERLLGSGLPADDAFLSEMRAAAAQSGVRAYLLFLGGKGIAYVYCPMLDGILIYAYVGYDPDHQDLSPGTVLQYLILQKLFDEGKCRMFDFTEGEGQQKAFFATRNTLCADVYSYSPTVANTVAVRLHSVLDRLSDSIGSVLDRLGLKAGLRRLMRRLA